MRPSATRAPALLLEAIEAFAVSARMSLSTMALGRLHARHVRREPEPWLSQAAATSLPQPPRESTISITNGTGSEPVAAAGRTVPPSGAQTDAEPVGTGPTSSISRAARARDARSEPSAAEWNAKSYPTMQPAYASTSPLPPDTGSVAAGAALAAAGAAAAGAADRSRRRRRAAARCRTSMPIAALAAGSRPWPQPSRSSRRRPRQFGASPARVPDRPSRAADRQHAARLRRRSPGSSERDVVSAIRAAAREDDEAVRLKPNRRPLFIGLGALVVGIIVIIVARREWRSAGSTPRDDIEDGRHRRRAQAARRAGPGQHGHRRTAHDQARLAARAGRHVLIAGTKVGGHPVERHAQARPGLTDPRRASSPATATVSSKIDLRDRAPNDTITLAKLPAPAVATGPGCRAGWLAARRRHRTRPRRPRQEAERAGPGGRRVAEHTEEGSNITDDASKDEPDDDPRAAAWRRITTVMTPRPTPRARHHSRPRRTPTRRTGHASALHRGRGRRCTRPGSARALPARRSASTRSIRARRQGLSAAVSSRPIRRGSRGRPRTSAGSPPVTLAMSSHDTPGARSRRTRPVVVDVDHREVGDDRVDAAHAGERQRALAAGSSARRPWSRAPS